MSTVLAIEIAGTQAVLVTARTEADAPIEILSRRYISLVDPETDVRELAGAEESQENSSGAEGVDPYPSDLSGKAAQIGHEAIEIDLSEIDEAVAIVSSERVLYNVTDLPFTDHKKIEQVAPLQVQDALPFEIDDYVVDSMVVGPGTEDKHRVVSSLAPREQVANALSGLRKLGIDPRFVTTRASALGALAHLAIPDSTGLTAILELGTHEAALAVLRDGNPYLLRNFPLPSGSVDIILRDIRCSLAQAEAETKLRLRTVHLIGNQSLIDAAQNALGPAAKPFDFKRLAVNRSVEDLPVDEIAWSLGLTATEILRVKKSNYPVVNFRQGHFAYRRLWQELWAALKQEMFYIVTALLLIFVYYTSVIFTNHRSLNEVENKIDQMLSEQLPGESVPNRVEETYLKSKVNDLEEQLRKMGSLSTLSPLQSMKELADAIGNDLDVSLDSLEVASSRITMRGSVASNPVFSNLSTALKSRTDRFCSVQADSKGRTATGRVAFSAEIELCE